MGVMRLYCKLLLMIVLAGGLQHFAPPSAWGGEAWFALRCYCANALGDRALAERLVEEHYQEIHSDEEEIQLRLEIELALAQEAGDPRPDERSAAARVQLVDARDFSVGREVDLAAPAAP